MAGNTLLSPQAFGLCPLSKSRPPPLPCLTVPRPPAQARGSDFHVRGSTERHGVPGATWTKSWSRKTQHYDPRPPQLADGNFWGALSPGEADPLRAHGKQVESCVHTWPSSSTSRLSPWPHAITRIFAAGCHGPPSGLHEAPSTRYLCSALQAAFAVCPRPPGTLDTEPLGWISVHSLTRCLATWPPARQAGLCLQLLLQAVRYHRPPCRSIDTEPRHLRSSQICPRTTGPGPAQETP